MSLEIKLDNEQLASYSRTDNALEAFYKSVDNGQSRLALEVLAVVIAGIVDKLETIENSMNPSAVVETLITEKEPLVKPKAKSTKDINEAIPSES